VPQHLVVARLFHGHDLALERQDGLGAAVASLLGGAACVLSLHQEQFAAAGIALGAIREFAGQAAAIQRAFAAGQITALRAASRARAASIALLMILRATAGFCSKNAPRRSLTNAC